MTFTIMKSESNPILISKEIAFTCVNANSFNKYTFLHSAIFMLREFEYYYSIDVFFACKVYVTNISNDMVIWEYV